MKEFGFSNELISAYKLAISQYRNNHNVFLIDIGNKHENYVRKEELCVRIHADSVITINPEYSDFQLIYYPNFGEKRSVVSKELARTQRANLVLPGISLGTSVTGTLGLICYDKLNGLNKCLLTAAHVIPGEIGSPVTQPGGGLDRGRIRNDTIGNILRFDPGGDAAIASFNKWRNEPDLKQFGTKNTIKNLGKVQIGDILTKSGRTSGVTKALVDGIGVYFLRTSYSVKVIKGFKLVPLNGQNSKIEEISDKGDSGSIWFDPSKNAGIGLLIAGANSTKKYHLNFSFAQHLEDIFLTLKISI